MIKAIAFVAVLGFTASTGMAQIALPAAKSGGLAGMLGGGLPNIASSSAGNAAGVLGYCVKNNLLSGANAASVLGGLTGKAGVATSDDYAAGQAGKLETGKGSALSLDGLKGQAKTKVCSLVLNHAKSFL